MAENVKTEVLDGRKIAESIRQQAKKDIALLTESYPDFIKPKIVIVQVQKRSHYSALLIKYT